MSLWYIILFILNYRKGFIMKRPTLHKLIFSILLFAISFLALFTSHKSSAFADWYSSTIYLLFVSSIGRFFGIFQFSVSEIGLYIFVILLFLSLVRMLISSIYKMYAKKRTLPGSATVPHSCFSADVCLPFILFSAESTTDILHLQKNITWNPVSILRLNWPLYATNWLIS